MIERHITVNVHADKTDALERFFADEYRPAMAKSPGFVSASLLREAESVTRYQMVLRFEDAESALGWRTSGVHEALQPALLRLYSDPQIQGYEVVI